MIQITRDHPTIALKDTVQSFAEPFFKAHGFNYFQYLRCFSDGSFSCLANITDLFELFSQFKHTQLIYSSYNQEHENLQSYWFLWDEELPAFPVSLARSQCQLHHGFTLVRRTQHYYDMIGFALPQERLNIASFYLTKMKAVEQFIQLFEKQHQPIIEKLTKNPTKLPKINRDVNYQQLCLNHKQFEVNGRFGKVHITSRELACVKLLTEGATYKQAAQILTLSPRTVETYIARIKQRSGMSTRGDLTELIAALEITD